jgi:hypothetical protein
VLYLQLIIFLVGGDVPVNSDALLVTNFMNLKIKPAQSFKCAHRDSMCVHMGSAHTCMSICVCIMFLKFFLKELFIFLVKYLVVIVEYLGLYYVSQKKLKELFIFLVKYLVVIVDNTHIGYKNQKRDHRK